MREIDFLTVAVVVDVDVEGMDLQVLRSNDWDRSDSGRSLGQLD
jgi:hypothetical protein